LIRLNPAWKVLGDFGASTQAIICSQEDETNFHACNGATIQQVGEGCMIAYCTCVR